jgi:hypothetical protein
MTSVQNTAKKDIAISLRKSGKTYGEVIEILKVPKSTVCSWLKGVSLSDPLKKQILERSREKWRKNITVYNQVYAKIRSQKAAEIREKYTKEAYKEIKKISEVELRLIGSSLFWAEGNKKNRNALCFSNSDPAIIKVMMRFFRDICEIPDEKIKPRAHIYPGIDCRKTLEFWSKTTGLPQNNFYSPQVQISRVSKGRRPRNTLPFGTLHITAGNTEITSKVKGWIRGIAEKT